MGPIGGVGKSRVGTIGGSGPDSPGKERRDIMNLGWLFKPAMRNRVNDGTLGQQVFIVRKGLF